jgi:hypothetical protein
MLKDSNLRSIGTNKVCAQEDPQQWLKVLLVAGYTTPPPHIDPSTIIHSHPPMILLADRELRRTKVTRRMTRYKMKEPPSYPRLLDRNSLGRALDMEPTVGRANLADIIHSDGLLANPLREVGRGPYSTSRMHHFRSRAKSIMLIIHHRYLAALGSALQIER